MRALFGAVLLVVLAGCHWGAWYEETATPPRLMLAKDDTRQVDLYTSWPKRKHVVIGLIHSHPGKDVSTGYGRTRVVMQMRDEAARVGCDALIVLEQDLARRQSRCAVYTERAAVPGEKQ